MESLPSASHEDDVGFAQIGGSPPLPGGAFEELDKQILKGTWKPQE